MKHTKRSMLITTILMVAVLVVAISTSTFAWYTSNTAVSATETTLGSASSSSANLEFVWKSGSNVLYRGTEVSFTGVNTIQPMVPTANFEAGTTADTAITFVGSTVDATNTIFTNGSSLQTPWTQQYTSTATGTEYALVDAEPADWATAYTTYFTKNGETYVPVPYGASAPAFAQNQFYSKTESTSDDYGLASGITVTNLYLANSATDGTSGALELSISVTDNTNNILDEALRVAVCIDGIYKGTLASFAGSTTYYATDGSWDAQDTVAESLSSNTTAVNKISIDSIDAGGEVEIQLFAWFDGSMLNNANAGQTAKFRINVGLAA